MQSWSSFPDDESEACDAILAPPPRLRSSNSNSYTERNWNFQVLMHEDIYSAERVAVVGSCESLGNWHLSGCILMTRDEGMLHFFV